MIRYRIQQVNSLTPKLWQVQLVPIAEHLNFVAGQYLEICLGDDKQLYSLANFPQTDGSLELHIQVDSDNAFARKLKAQLQQEHFLAINGPFGNMVYQADALPTLLLAGGVGFAPFKAILAEAKRQNDTRLWHLFWGISELADCYYLDELLNSTADFIPQNFKFTPVLYASEDPAWDGAIGYVHDAVRVQYKNLNSHHVYLSGPMPMVLRCQTELQKLGLESQHTFSDLLELTSNVTR